MKNLKLSEELGKEEAEQLKKLLHDLTHSSEDSLGLEMLKLANTHLTGGYHNQQTELTATQAAHIADRFMKISNLFKEGSNHFVEVCETLLDEGEEIELSKEEKSKVL